MLSFSNILRSFLPLIWSSEPWEIPNIKIRIKQNKVEIVKLLNLKITKEKILQNKKKINEWLKFIFLIVFFILFN